MRGANLSLDWVYRVALLAAVWLGGCAPGQGDVPSEAAARAFYESEFTELITPGILKVVSFKKTNGVKRGEGGEENYELEYEAELEFPKGWLPHCVDMKQFDMGCQMARTRGARPQPVGAKKQDKGKVLFEKTEKGWRPKGVQAGWLDPFGG